MANKKSYAELVTEAEQAVAGVKDAELRRAAFDRVLTDLLGNPPVHESGSSTVPKEGGKRTTRRRMKSTTGGSSAGRGGPQKYIAELADEGYFKKQKTISEVKAELGNRGHHIPLTSLSGPLQKPCQKKVLRRQKIENEDGKKTYGYSNW